MNRCIHYRKEMAVLASEPGDRPFPSTLHQHLTHCPSCREYWEQINALTLFFASDPETGDTTLSPQFHDRWLRQTAKQSTTIAAPTQRLPSSWPFKAAFAVLLLLLAAILIKPDRKTAPQPSRTIDTAASNNSSTLTLLHYQLARSDSELDSLLSRQSARSHTSTRSYTMLSRAEEESY